MRWMHAWVLAGALAWGGAAAPRCAAEADAGQPAPAFTATDTAGTPHSLEALKGKFVVLEWFNHECPFVRKHYGSGNMQRLQQEWTTRGVIWLSVNSSAPGKQGHLSPEQADALTAEKSAAPTAVILDPAGALGRLYGAKTTPHLFVINPEGVVVYAGAIDDHASTDPADIPQAVNYVQEALESALAGQPVATPQTRSYGCSVKY